MNYSLKFLIFIYGLTSSLYLFANEAKICEKTEFENKEKDLLSVVEKIEPKEECSTKELTDKQITELCKAIKNRSSAKNIEKYRLPYAYQEILYELACLDSKSEDEKIIKNMNTMWNQYGEKIKCENGANVKFNFIVFGFKNLNEEFVDNIINWEIPIDKIKHDDISLQLFLKKEIESGYSPDIKEKYQSFYELVTEAIKSKKIENKTEKK